MQRRKERNHKTIDIIKYPPESKFDRACKIVSFIASIVTFLGIIGLFFSGYSLHTNIRSNDENARRMYKSLQVQHDIAQSMYESLQAQHDSIEVTRKLADAQLQQFLLSVRPKLRLGLTEGVIYGYDSLIAVLGFHRHQGISPPEMIAFRDMVEPYMFKMRNIGHGCAIDIVVTFSEEDFWKWLSATEYIFPDLGITISPDVTNVSSNQYVIKLANGSSIQVTSDIDNVQEHDWLMHNSGDDPFVIFLPHGYIAVINSLIFTDTDITNSIPPITMHVAFTDALEREWSQTINLYVMRLWWTAMPETAPAMSIGFQIIKNHNAQYAIE